ncbi:hypothetical protein Nos7524_1984 [Nostoc sp. PCC 7524]|uniref:hypothetical protein n=1 Tax=Nostoc sp. (strain ATCC 29411 / PCC 7524) TaxID=28072 RepID=UPI00029F0FFE|nr:hypothetical protein [Nostoc sp. PCC 7524]AFY47842.1 hypothetical protein Nos7524_1984 [Nostoc sp. PCC 7524]
MASVIIERNKNNVPSDQDIKTAMAQSGGTVTNIEADKSTKKVTFAGQVNHNKFQNNLEKVANGSKQSWNFFWADAESSIVQFPKITLETAVATNYSVSINMEDKTVEALSNNGYILYAFKAVKTTAKGSPVVWFKTTNYGLNTQISWSEEYEAYTSKTDIKPNALIIDSNSYPISLDNTLNITSPTGTGSVDTSKGTPGAINIHNQTSTQFTTGISQKLGDGTVNPLCAFPLFGNMLDIIAPLEKVVLMFSTTPVNTGSVIEQSFSPAILIDLTGENSRTVSFDINNGWSWGGAPWGRNIPASGDLVPFLIESATANSSIVNNHLIALHEQRRLA